MKKTICGEEALPFYAAFGFEDNEVDIPVAIIRSNNEGIMICVFSNTTVAEIAIRPDETTYSETYLGERIMDEFRLTPDGGLTITQSQLCREGEVMDMTPEKPADVARNIDFVKTIAETAYKFAKPYVEGPTAQKPKVQSKQVRQRHKHGLH